MTTDYSKVDNSTGTLFRVINTDEETITVSAQRILEEEAAYVELDRTSVTGSVLTRSMEQRASALGVARMLLEEQGRKGAFVSQAETKIVGLIPEALIDLADYIVTGQPLACERSTRALDRLSSDMDKQDAAWSDDDH